MKKFLFIITVLLFVTISFSAIIAMTGDGKKVILYENFTWQWYSGPTPAPTPTPSPELTYNIVGTWNFNIQNFFTEEFSGYIYHDKNGNLMINWKGANGLVDEKVQITITAKNEFQFETKTFHYDDVIFHGVLKSDTEIDGVTMIQGTFSGQGKFSAKKTSN
jgi:hypothetical protein